MMATMGKYCKAYSLKSLRAYSGWTEKSENICMDGPLGESHNDGSVRTLMEDAYLFLQENYVVTDGVFLDKHIIFDAVTPEWIEYCHTSLGFEIPEFEPIDTPVNA